MGTWRMLYAGTVIADGFTTEHMRTLQSALDEVERGWMTLKNPSGQGSFVIRIGSSTPVAFLSPDVPIESLGLREVDDRDA